MSSARALLRQFGYTDIRPLKLRANALEVTGLAWHHGEPRVALTSRPAGSRQRPVTLWVPELPETVSHLLFGDQSPRIFQRSSGSDFDQAWHLPKAGGPIWGQHEQVDLIPIRALDEMLDMGRRLGPRHGLEAAMALVLVGKLLDESRGDPLRFRFGDEGVQDVLTDLAGAAGASVEWLACTEGVEDAVRDLALAWEPYAFLPWVETHGVFGELLGLLGSASPGIQVLQPPVVCLVQEFLAGCHEPIAIVGEGACGLLDFGLRHAKPCVRVCQHCSPAVAALAERLIPGFELKHDDLLTTPSCGTWPSVVCVPPIGMREVIPAVARGSTLLRELGRTGGRVLAELLWVEKCHSVLCNGGVLCAVLPEGLLSNASLADARRWLLERFQLRAVVELPPGGMIRTGVKLSLVVMVRTTAPPRDYPVFMASVAPDDPTSCREVIDAYRRGAEGARP